jgi:hypothetical protein
MEARRLRHERLSKVRRELDCAAYPVKLLVLFVSVVFMIVFICLMLLALPLKSCIKNDEALHGAVATLVVIPFLLVQWAIHAAWGAIVISIAVPLSWLIKSVVACKVGSTEKDEVDALEATRGAAILYLLSTVKRTIVQNFEAMAQPRPPGGEANDETPDATTATMEDTSAVDASDAGAEEEIRTVEHAALGRVENL